MDGKIKQKEFEFGFFCKSANSRDEWCWFQINIWSSKYWPSPIIFQNQFEAVLAESVKTWAEVISRWANATNDSYKSNQPTHALPNSSSDHITRLQFFSLLEGCFPLALQLDIAILFNDYDCFWNDFGPNVALYRLNDSFKI